MRFVCGLSVASLVALGASPGLAMTAGVLADTGTPAFCFALNARFADAIRQQAGEDTAASMAFARRANRIEKAVLAPHQGDVDAQAAEEKKLRVAVENFDFKSFDALPEAEAEAIITQCAELSGPDE